MFTKFNLQYSRKNRSLPSGFGHRTTGLVHSLVQSRIISLRGILSPCSLLNFFHLGPVLYGCWRAAFDSGNNSTVCSVISILSIRPLHIFECSGIYSKLWSSTLDTTWSFGFPSLSGINTLNFRKYAGSSCSTSLSPSTVSFSTFTARTSYTDSLVNITEDGRDKSKHVC